MLIRNQAVNMIAPSNFQRKIKKGDCIFFLHISKTAGTTAYRFIMEQFPPSTVFIVPDENYQNHFADTYPDQFSTFRFFRQHASYDEFRFLPRKPIMMTFLRNPIDRVISFYKHVRRVDDHYLHHRVISDHLRITEFMDLSPVETTNFQTCSLLGFRVANSCKDSGERLAIAKMRLHEFDFFGIQECFQESMRLLCHLFGWELKKYDSFFIAPAKDPEFSVDESEIEIIRERNQLDMELYQYAVQEFKKRVDAILTQ
jgi:hypothetical protein